MPWLLLTRLFVNPGHQQQRYGQIKVGKSLAILMIYVNYQCQFSVEETYIIQIYNHHP